MMATADDHALNYDVIEDSETSDGPKFVPPLYIQRYGFVRGTLHKHKVKSVVDFGSAQCKILTLLKTVPSLESITLVDLDRRMLETNKACIKPLLFDFLKRRENPLTIRVYHGDATQHDSRLTGCEAVSMVEFIEHLVPSDLDMVAECVFGELCPKLVVITTPNSEFNVLFPNFSGFRHWDHKFEWTRREFQTWCEHVCRNYGYSVVYDGIGDPPDDSKHLGHCSQAAIFTLTHSSSSVDTMGCDCYDLVAECNYPYQKQKQTPDEKLAIEVQYYIHQLTLNSDLEEGEGHTVIPLEKLLCFRQIRELCDINKLRSYLRSYYTLSEDGERVLVPLEEWDLRDDDVLETEDVRDTDEDKNVTHIESTAVVTEDSWD